MSGSRARSARGFSLVELIVALGLGGLMLAAAFELHVTFDRQSARQQKIVEMQQNLRAARVVLERTIRGAGMGFQSGSLVTPTCAIFHPIQFHEDNAFPAGAVWGLGQAANIDGDPDWLQVVAPTDLATSSASCPGGSCGGTLSAQGQTVKVQCVQNFSAAPGPQDWVVVIDTTSAQPNPPTKLNCVYPIAGIAAGAACGAGCNCGTLTLGPGCAAQINNPPGPFPRVSCTPPSGVPPPAAPWAPVQYPAPVRLLGSGTAAAPIPALTILRIETANTAACPTPPCLLASYSPLGAPPANNAAPSWTLVAEYIEDMQFAFIMNDGRTCGTAGYAVDDPATCDPRAVKAVRFSLTARSPAPVEGFNLGSTGGTEDRNAVQTGDGFIRRTVTAEVQLRNNP